MTTKFALPSAEQLMDRARGKTALDHFGEDDFQEGLRRLLDSVEHEANLGESASARLIATIENRLINRLQVEEWYRTHPELDDVTLAPPVSITGLPRTGTTALVNVLSLDDQFRPLRGWEQHQPCPPPVLAEEARDPRRIAAVEQAERLRQDNPEFAAMHLTDVDATEEDFELLGMSFHGLQLVLPISGYHAWWAGTDMRGAFAYHRRVAKLLLSRRPPNRWLFKAPAHNFHLDGLFSAYPDARVIVTHRDPAKVIPSVVSLLSSLHPPEPGTNVEAFGRRISDFFRLGVARSLAARAALGEDKFFDVHHSDFLADPMGTIGRVYRFLDLEWRPETRAKMEAWHQANRSGTHGTHRYTPEQFGLSVAQLHADFDFYIERFSVPLGR